MTFHIPFPYTKEDAKKYIEKSQKKVFKEWNKRLWNIFEMQLFTYRMH